MPALLNRLEKYLPLRHTWTALLANANTGGENVHRGSILGAVLGSQEGLEQMIINSPHLIKGLHDYEALSVEIDEFVSAVMK